VPAQNALHLIFEMQLLFLEPDFFELFGFREVVAGRQVVNLLVEIVMLRGELAELLVCLQQLLPQLLEVCRHPRLLFLERTAIGSGPS
jgi:hypothetical protein